MSRDWRIEEAERNAKAEREGKIIAAVILIVVAAAIIGLTLWIRHSAACWIFPLAEAPTRCLPGAR